MPVLKKRKRNDSMQLLKVIEDTSSLASFPKSFFADIFNTINISAQIVASFADTQKKLAESLVEGMAPINQLKENVGTLLASQIELKQNFNKMIAPSLNIAPIVPNFAELFPVKSSIADAVQIGSKMADLIQPVDMCPLFEPFSQIKEFIKNIVPPTTHLFDGIADVIKPVFDFVGSAIESFKRAFEPFIKFIQSNYVIIVYASRGDKVALHHLGKIWWRLGLRYCELQRLKGRQPNKKEFELLVQEICWEVLVDIKQKDGNWLNAAKIVYYSVIAKLFLDYIEISRFTRLNDNIDGKIIPGNSEYKLSIYKDEANNPQIFIKTIAEQLQVTPQTVRNWVKSGDVVATKMSYFSRIKQAVIPTYLIPYQPSILADLKKVKDKQAMKKKHQLDGYFTRSQVANWFNISVKTLERWDKNGKLVPKRINGYRYYSESQRDQVPGILMANQSPKIKCLLSSHTLAVN